MSSKKFSSMLSVKDSSSHLVHSMHTSYSDCQVETQYRTDNIIDHFRNRFHDIVCNMTSEQSSIVAEIGFSSLLSIPTLQFCSPHFDVKLLQNVNTACRTIHFSEHCSVSYEEDTVYAVFGIPAQGHTVHDISRDSFTGVLEYARKSLGMANIQDNVCLACETALTRKYCFPMTEPDKDAYALAFVTYVVFSFLVPPDTTFGLHAPFMESLVCRESIKDHNWSAYVIQRIHQLTDHVKAQPLTELLQSSQRYSFPFLQILCCDNISSHGTSIDRDLHPRVSAYANIRLESLLNGHIVSRQEAVTRGNKLVSQEPPKEKLHPKIFEKENETVLMPRSSLKDSKHSGIQHDKKHSIISSSSQLMVRFKKERAIMIRTLTFIRRTMEDRLDVLHQDIIDSIDLQDDNQNLQLAGQKNNSVARKNMKQVHFQDEPVTQEYSMAKSYNSQPSKMLLDQIKFAKMQDLESNIQCELLGRAPMSRDMLDMCIRQLLQTVNSDVHSYETMKTRHIIESDFAIICSMNGRPTLSETVRTQFTSGFGVRISRGIDKVFFPFEFKEAWCCFILQLFQKRIEIYDPMQIQNNDPEILTIFTKVAQSIQHGFAACLRCFLNNNSVANSQWPISTLESFHAPCSSAESGIYVINFMLEYTGHDITSIITKDTIMEKTAELLYSILHIEDNSGKLPTSILIKI
ncbi:hypothetical protein ACP70R_000556 [Stipagrostis hirtigluma subsp. patula]